LGISFKGDGPNFQILRGAHSYDLSRYLLVTLILANMQNVEVVVGDRDGTSTSTDLKLKLLKMERHHQVFEDEQRLITGGHE